MHLETTTNKTNIILRQRKNSNLAKKIKKEIKTNLTGEQQQPHPAIK